MLNLVPHQTYSVDHRDTVQPAPYPFNPTLVANCWRSNDNYVFTYQPGSDEFLVTTLPGGIVSPPNHYWDVVNRIELEKLIQVGPPALHIYYDVGAHGGVNQWLNRYYYQAGLYTQVPTQRVLWIDIHDRFVDTYNRVLTNNGQFVRKYYAVTKLANQYIIPFKMDNSDFARALPALFGGNMDPGDVAPVNTIQRETDEEGQSQYTITAISPGTVYAVQSAGNSLEFYTVTVTPSLQPVTPLHEMAGRFTCQAADFVGHMGNVNAFQTQLLALFQAYLGGPAAPVGVNIPTAAYIQQMLGLLPMQPATGAQIAALAEWRGSSSIEALYRAVSSDVGLIGVQSSAVNAAAPAVGGAVNAHMRQAWLDYIAGETAVRDSALGTAAPTVPGVSEAHRQAWLDYVAGETAVRGSAPGTAAAGVALAAGRPRSHQQAWLDYVAGETAVWGSAPGTAAAGVSLAGGRPRSHQQAWQDYSAGEVAVRLSTGGPASILAHRAHQVAWTDYIAGVTTGNNAVVAGHRAYQDASNNYIAGYNAGREGGPNAAHYAFITGHAAGAATRKKQKT